MIILKHLHMTCSTELSSVLHQIKHANKIKQEHALSKLNNTKPLDLHNPESLLACTTHRLAPNQTCRHHR